MANVVLRLFPQRGFNKALFDLIPCCTAHQETWWCLNSFSSRLQSLSHNSAWKTTSTDSSAGAAGRAQRLSYVHSWWHHTLPWSIFLLGRIGGYLMTFQVILLNSKQFHSWNLLEKWVKCSSFSGIVLKLIHGDVIFSVSKSLSFIL